MKLTTKKLRKLIREAIYFPAGTTPEDIEYFNQLRSMHSPEDRKTADEIAAADFNMGFQLGGLPPEKPEKEMITLKKDDGNYGYGKYRKAGGAKEIAMAIEDDIQNFITTNGTKVQQSEDPDDYYYIIPEDQVYRHFMRHENLSEDVIDYVIEINSYGIGYQEINLLGRKVNYLTAHEY